MSKSTATWSAAELPSFEGRTVIITGANSGLGLETTRELARVGAHVIMAVRNTEKGNAAKASIKGSTEVRQVDVADLASVRAFADTVEGADILVNNAGIMMVPPAKTVDGFESQIGTNHLGAFALTNLLLPKLTDRVIAVSSVAHRAGKIDLSDLNYERRRYTRAGAYGASKLANLLFTKELQRRLSAAGSPVRALTVHPGVAATELQSHSGSVSSGPEISESGPSSPGSPGLTGASEITAAGASGSATAVASAEPSPTAPKTTRPSAGKKRCATARVRESFTSSIQ
ncbi:Probable short-chain dehydrogenase/reductase [Mycobacteroides abscessus]|nr:Probable short-chain dehydrogenase/reductase [Mycobacteroides abscessus]